MKKIIQPFIFAVQFLTRIPVPSSIPPDDGIARKALMLFPPVGLLIGCVLYAVWLGLSCMSGFNTLTVAVILIAVETVLTGAFHLDGLADTFDAFLSSGKTPEEKLAIMKDSRIGVMGCVALILALLLKIALLAGLLDHHSAAVLLVYPVAGRWAQVVAYVLSPYVREGGIGSIFARNADKSTLTAASLFLIPCFALPGFFYAVLLLAVFLWLFRGYVHRQIGGITGDVLGSITVLSEIVLLAGIGLLFP